MKIHLIPDDNFKDILEVTVDAGEATNVEEAIDAFYKLSQYEGIIPALESAHAVAFAMKYAAQHPKESILVNLSGRGDKDIDYVIEHYPIPVKI